MRVDGKSYRGFYSKLELTPRNFSLPQPFPSTAAAHPSSATVPRDRCRKSRFLSLFAQLSSPLISAFSQKGAFEIDEFAEFYANFASCEKQRKLATGEMIKMRINFRLYFSSLSSNFSDSGS